MPRTPKSPDGVSVAKVTRSSRRAGSVDQELDHSSRTPLKSNLESISETGSIDSLTPRRSTRRSIAPPDLGTPAKMQLTKENLSRLENLEDSIKNTPSAGKRITRRTSMTSEDAQVQKSPFIRLVRTRLAKQAEEIEKQEGERSRRNMTTIETPTKAEDKLGSPIRTRRTSSKSTTLENNSRNKQTEQSPVSSDIISQNTLSSGDASPGSNIGKKTNPTSTPKIVTPQKITKTIDIDSNNESDSTDNEDTKDQYYRNTSLKKFTGTSKNIDTESQPVIVENKLDKEITILNDTSFEKDVESNDQINTKGNFSNYKSKLSLSNLSNFETEGQTQDNSNGGPELAQHGPSTKEVEEKAAKADISGTVDQNISDKKTMDTPIKEVTKTPVSLRKLTPKNDIATPVKLVISPKDVPTKLEIPAKPKTPTKLTTPVKLATPVKSLDPVPSQEVTPIKSAYPFKNPTPVKNSPRKLPEKLTTVVQNSSNKIGETEETSVTKSPTTEIIPKSPNKSNLNNNLSQHMEVSDNGSRILLIQEDDVCVQVPVDGTYKQDNSSHKCISTSFSSTDDQDNIENKSSDESFAETFENFTKNIVIRKAKSCSPQMSKNFVQRQIISSSFSSVRNTDTKLGFDKIINSKMPSGSFVMSTSFVEEDNHGETESVAQVESSKTEMISTKARQRSSVSFTKSKSGYFEEADNIAEMEPVKQNVSKSESGSAKKINRRSLSISESGLCLSSSASGSFIEVDNKLKAEQVNVSIIEPGSAKKSKRRSSLAACEMFLETDIQEDSVDELHNKGLDSAFVTKRKNKSPVKRPLIEGNDDQEIAALPSASIEEMADNEQNESSRDINLNNSKIKKQKKTPIKAVIPEKREISLKVIQAKCDEILKERELARKALRDEFGKKKDKKPKKKERKRSPSPVVMEISKQKSPKQPSPKSTKLPNLEPELKISSAEEGTKRKLDKIVESTNSESPTVKKMKKRDVSEKIQSEANHRAPDIIIYKLDENSKFRRLPEIILTQLEDKPVSSAPSKKIKFPKFEEKEKTPEIRPSGFKVSPITPKILSNNFRVSVVPKQKTPKRKLKFNEPTNVLPQPVWTTAGIFEESDMDRDNRINLDHYSTTNFIVEDIGGEIDRAAGYSKADKHRKAELKEFKQQNLFRSNVPRTDAKHVLKSKGFEKANIKFISK